MIRALCLLTLCAVAYVVALLLAPTAFNLASGGGPRLAFAVAVMVAAVSGAVLIGWLTREHVT